MLKGLPMIFVFLMETYPVVVLGTIHPSQQLLFCLWIHLCDRSSPFMPIHLVVFRSARTSCTTSGWPDCPSFRPKEKSGSLIYMHTCLLNHQKSHQTNLMVSGSPLSCPLSRLPSRLLSHPVSCPVPSGPLSVGLSLHSLGPWIRIKEQLADRSRPICPCLLRRKPLQILKGSSTKKFSIA